MEIQRLDAEIYRMRIQIRRQKADIRSLLRAGINAAPAEAQLVRMHELVGRLCAERDQKIDEQSPKYPGTNKCIRGTPAVRQMRT